MKGPRRARMPVYGAGIQKETEGVALVSTRHRPPAIPIAPLHPYKIADGRLMKMGACGWAGAQGREEITLLNSASVSA